jgi:hypothetical protein
MIEVDINTFFFIMIVIPIITLLLSWLYVEQKYKSRQTRPESQIVSRCDICQLPFMHDKDEVISKCPRCGSYLQFREN